MPEKSVAPVDPSESLGGESEERFVEVVDRLVPHCKYERFDPRLLRHVVLEVQRVTGYDADKLCAYKTSKFLDIVEVAADIKEEGRRRANWLFARAVAFAALGALFAAVVYALVTATPPAI